MSNTMLHTCIRVRDLEKSLTFYQEALGLREVRRKDVPENKFTLVYLAFEENGFELELTYNYDQMKAYDIGNGYGHLAIGVDDLNAAHEKHVANDYTVTKIFSLPGSKTIYYFITDPDGYKTEIIQNNTLS
ncbi:VOC family protein [Listeria sp. PSOL-1]|uniref:lactoylglutathione lyase n=1 Tax=Listeria sp. PSOL-1 TaxID=1844999 RepID=UPI0013D103A7|nr:VOC family protein [Listeria sp. PSOL-1]